MKISEFFIAVSVGLGFITLILLGVIIRFPPAPDITMAQLVIGSQGLVPLLLSIATTIGAAITVILLFRRAQHDSQQLEHSREVARIALFKDAAVLLGQSNVACASGISIFADLAFTFPHQFLAHVTNALAAFASEKTSVAWHAYVDAMREKKECSERLRAPLVVLNALGVLGNVRPQSGGPWPNFIAAGDGRFQFGWIYLDKGNIQAADFSYCDIRTLIVRDFTFQNCNFSNTRIDLFAGDEVLFLGCTFSNSFINLHDIAGRRLNDKEFNARVVLHGCRIGDPSRIGDVPIEADLAVGKVPVQPADSETSH